MTMRVRDFASRLSIGSAQFGLDYGVSNGSGRVSPEMVSEILTEANAAGISLVDTAKGYGSAEEVLGGGANRFSFVTKVLGIEERGLPPNALVEECRDSIRKLKVDRIEALLLHRESDLLGPNATAIWAALKHCQESGLVKKIGVSSHNPQNLERVLRKFPVEIIQVPVNALDRRYLSPSLIAAYHEGKVEVHARSIFLQGFFFFLPEKLPPFLEFAQPEAAALWAEAKALGLSAAQLGISFALSQDFLAKIVFAVTSVRELREVLDWPVRAVPAEALRRLAEISLRTQGKLQDPLQWNMPARGGS